MGIEDDLWYGVWIDWKLIDDTFSFTDEKKSASYYATVTFRAGAWVSHLVRNGDLVYSARWKTRDGAMKAAEEAYNREESFHKYDPENA